MTGGTVTAVGGGVVCALLIVMVAVLAATYNRLSRLRGQAEASWTQIEVQLNRRYDLVPHLADTVAGYAAHQRRTLDAAMAARGNAMAVARRRGLAGRAEAEGELSEAVGRLLAVSEAYPGLKANQDFVTLQVELTNADDRVAYARQSYNSAVDSYNDAVRSLPTSLVAAVTGFRARDFFQATSRNANGKLTNH